MKYKRLKSSPILLNTVFFDRDPQIVARALIGILVVRIFDTGEIASGRIVETEAYLPLNDPAAHGARGPTPGNRSLYMEAGTLYIHSMHRQFCMDIVTQDCSQPGSVLVRAIEPVSGIEVMSQNRRNADLRKLTNGPGKLCQALAITKFFDKKSVTADPSPIQLFDDGTEVSESQIIQTQRVGLSKGTDLRLRFCLTESKYLSRGTSTQTSPRC